MPSHEAVRLNAEDNVIVLPMGGTIGGSACGVTLAEDVLPGHKMAAATIKQGETVIKYGHTIGKATRDIMPGEWVHEHNVRTCLADGVSLPEWTEKRALFPEPRDARHFMGYRRRSGRPGIRNDLWIIPTVGCVNGELRALVRRYSKPAWIDSVKIMEHPYGCSQLGNDLELTLSILAGLAHNPNAAGVLLAGLGCENLQVEKLLEKIRESTHTPNLRYIVMQDAAENEAEKKLDELAEGASKERERFDASRLCVGVKCGGSDGYSGLSANPLVGRFSDWLVGNGGVILATEIPEMFGAEDVIAGRIAEKSINDDFMAMDKWFRDYYVRYGQPIFENPSPGNKAGGITTLEEKSLGAVEKTGAGPVTSVLRYGEQVRDAGGVQIVFAPGNDIVSCTSLAGSGAQMVLFTTGRGTPFGTVIPTLKISTNSALARRRPDWTDFDAGTVLSGEPWETAEKRLIDKVIQTASGESAAHERKEIGEIAIFKDGVTL
jgi:altronate hydrolase